MDFRLDFYLPRVLWLQDNARLQAWKASDWMALHSCQQYMQILLEVHATSKRLRLSQETECNGRLQRVFGQGLRLQV